MRVLLDDEPCAHEGDSVGAAIAAAAAIAKEQGRMIVQIVVDGEQWTSDQLNAEGLIAGEADEVRLVSAEPRQLASAVFKDAGEALDSAEAHQSRAAEMIQSGDTAGGLREFNEALNTWLAVQQAVEQAADVAGIDLETAEFGDLVAGKVLERLSTQLQQIRDQLGQGDLVGVADSLLYDLPAVLEEWRALLSNLGKELKE